MGYNYFKLCDKLPGHDFISLIFFLLHTLCFISCLTLIHVFDPLGAFFKRLLLLLYYGSHLLVCSTFIRLFLRWWRKTPEMLGMKWMGSVLFMEMNLFPVFMKILEFPLNNFLRSKVNIILGVCPPPLFLRNPIIYPNLLH